MTRPAAQGEAQALENDLRENGLSSTSWLRPDCCCGSSFAAPDGIADLLLRRIVKKADPHSYRLPPHEVDLDER